MQKRIFSLAVIVMCLSIIGTGTLAYFADSTTAHNVITTGGVEIELLEWADEDKTVPFEAVEGVTPGESVTKIVEVKNNGSADAWIRVAVEKNVTGADKNSLDDGVITINYDTQNWIYQDGYYYYTEALGVGDITEPLFGEVYFAPSMGNDYQNCTVNIDVNAQATQVANNGKTVFEAAKESWPGTASTGQK